MRSNLEAACEVYVWKWCLDNAPSTSRLPIEFQPYVPKIALQNGWTMEMPKALRVRTIVKVHCFHGQTVHWQLSYESLRGLAPVYKHL